MSNANTEALVDDLITKVKSLIVDIESMRCVPQYSEDNDSWFGPFSESEDCGDDGQSVEWPNLAIATDQVKASLASFETTNE